LINEKAFFNDSAYPQAIEQTNIATIGKQYKVSFTVSDFQSGNVKLRHPFEVSGVQADGDYVFYGEAASTGITLRGDGVPNNFKLDNISVKEVGQHWTFNTGWSTDGTKAISDTSSGYVNINQTTSVAINKSYKVSFTLSDYSAGNVQFVIGNSGARPVGQLRSSNGTYTENITVDPSVTIDTGLLAIRGGASGFTGSVDNIVVQELKHDATNLMLNAGAYQSANPLITSTKSMEFDGTDDYLNAGVLPDSFTTAYSLSAWIWTDESSGNHQIFSTGQGAFSQIYQIGTGLKLQILGGTGYQDVIDADYFDTAHQNTWVYLALVYNGATIKAYRNGIEVGSAALSGTLNSTTNEANIGRWQGGSEYWNGKITEVGAFNRALTSLEVASLYNQGMPTDLLVNRNNYQSGNPTVFNTKQVDFDGSDDYMDAGNVSTFDFTSSFTISAWIKPSGSSSYNAIVGKYTTNKGYWFILNGGNIRMGLQGTSQIDTFAQGGDLRDGNWHHVVAVNTTSDIKLFLDGVLINTTTGTWTPDSATSDNLLIGKRSGIDNFNGEISQIGLWNTTLTADEVSSLYNHGLPIDLTTDQAAYESSSNLVGYWRMGSGTLDSYPLIADQTNATLGSDVIVNGDFNGNANNWTLGNAVWQQGSGNGKVKLTKPSSGNAVIYQTGLSFQEGDVLRYKYKVIDFTGDSFIRIDGYSGANPLNTNTTFQASQGDVDVYIKTDRAGTGVFLYITGGSTGDTVVLDDVSVQIVQGNPAIMTNQTSSDIENGSPYANIVVNGNFATNSDWNLGSGQWVISNGFAVGTNASNNLHTNQPVAPSNGIEYTVTFTLKDVTSGYIRVGINIADSTQFNSDGTYSLNVTSSGNNYLYITPSNFNGKITNITATEVNTGLQGYWKMGDGTNDEYPVIYDQTNPTIGSNLVVNGTFETPVDSNQWFNFSSPTTAERSTTRAYAGSYSYHIVGDSSNDGTQAAGTQFTGDYTVGDLVKITAYVYPITASSNQIKTGVQNSSRSITSSYTVVLNEWNKVEYYVTISTASNNYITFLISGSAGEFYLDNVSAEIINGNPATMTNMVEGNITNQYPLTKIRNYYRMGDGILDGYPIIQDQTSPNLTHIPTTNNAVPSEVFSSWSLQNVTITTNSVVSPDGTQNASTITPTAVSGVHLLSTSGTNTVAMSVYAKQNGYTRFRFNSGSSGNGFASFNLATGVVAASGGTYLFDSGIEDVGNGWFRCFMVLRGGIATNMTIAVEDSSGQVSYTGDGTSGIHIWGSQSEDQLQPTTYIKSDGIAAVRKSSTTNLITYSEDFSGYSQVTGSITANSTTSPDGTLNASVFNALVGLANFYTRFTATVGLSYAQSIFLKKGTRNWATFVKSAGSGFAAWFDLENGVIGTVASGFSANMENVGDGWYRCSVISNATITLPYFQVVVVDDNNATTNSVAGSIFIWGTQAEQQTQAETYAKTTGLPVTIDLFTENNYGTMTNMSSSDIIEDTPNN
jgi:hypothetical protein